MCGIVGYIGSNQADEYLLNGLEALEYRGYDSAGVCVSINNKLLTTKVVGRVDALRKALSKNKSTLGIGHTRWATHGKPLERNAHPHTNKNQSFAVVHNGIIENYQEIKRLLIDNGYSFKSDTDTEIIPNLIDFHFKNSNDIEKSFLKAVKMLSGAYAIAMISAHDPEKIYAAKLSSPLAIGIGDNEMLLGSDGLPMSGRASEILFLEDNEAAVITSNSYKLINLLDDNLVERTAEALEVESYMTSKDGFPDYMLKEIHEAPQTVRLATLGRVIPDESIVKLGGLESVTHQLDYIDRIIIIACGTSYYAGMVGEYLIEEIANIPVEVQLASEFRYRNEPLSRSTAVLVVSQSGETADTIAAVKKLKGSGMLTLGVVNSPGSTLSRLTDAGVYCHAGPEKAVASTKAFISQSTVLALIALHLSKNYEDFKETLIALDELPSQLESILKNKGNIAKLAKKYSHHQNFVYVGRRFAYPVALEGALKLKEISYIHAEGFAGGEMKHGPLALIDKDLPTFAISLSNSVDEKSNSNIQEIKSRSGPIIAVVDDTNSEVGKIADDLIVIPRTKEILQPILSATVTHLFAYFVAKELGHDIDMPRNLAKSVTVE